MSRLAYQKLCFLRFGGGEVPRGERVLNIGVAENPADLPDRVVQFDIDLWKYPRSVCGDAHALPFRPECFDLVILGDVMEHLLHPKIVLNEVWRIVKRGGYFCLTVFKEWRLPGPGQHIDLERIQEEKESDMRQAGETDYVQWRRRESDGRCLDLYREDAMPHSKHINQFTGEELRAWIEDLSGVGILEWELVPEEYWQNWLILLRRES